MNIYKGFLYSCRMEEGETVWLDGDEREEGDNELWVDADEVAVQWFWGFF